MSNHVLVFFFTVAGLEDLIGAGGGATFFLVMGVEDFLETAAFLVTGATLPFVGVEAGLGVALAGAVFLTVEELEEAFLTMTGVETFLAAGVADLAPGVVDLRAGVTDLTAAGGGMRAGV